VLELTARDKACEHRDKACHGDSCPLAKGFYDRLPAARAESLAAGFMDGPALRGVALKHQVCPYYLGQEVARWSDLVVGDYNYYFDGSAMLHAMTLANEWRVGVLVDEAHNLVERARAMYSASLSQASLARGADDGAGRHQVGAGQGQSRLERTAQGARRGGRHAGRAAGAFTHRAQAGQRARWKRTSPKRARRRRRRRCSRPTSTSWASSGWPNPSARTRCSNSRTRPGCRQARGHGPHPEPDPAPFLKPRFAAARTVTLFSATLSPPRYYLDMLGLPETRPGSTWSRPSAPTSSRCRWSAGSRRAFPTGNAPPRPSPA
jgi:DNA excision repair protein ERCC-2